MTSVPETRNRQAATRDDLARIFDAAGVEGFAHAVDARGNEIGFSAHRRVQPGSCAKAALMIALLREVDNAVLRLEQDVAIAAGPRTPGSTGLSVMTDPAVLSLRDVLVSMMSVSDNHATDVLFDLVPPTRVTQCVRHLGLDATRVDATAADILARLNTPEADAIARQVEPDTSPWSSTPADMTRLLQLIWTDQAASSAACAQMRECLRKHALKRFAPGFHDQPVAIASKSGTVLNWRGEIGVIEQPGTAWVAAAVFVRSDNTDYYHHAADNAVAQAARVLADHLASMPARPA